MHRRLAPLPKSPLNTRAFLRRALLRVPAVLALPLLVLQHSALAATTNTEFDVINGQTDLTNAAGTTYTTMGTAGTGAGGTVTATPPSVTSDVTFDNINGNQAAYSPAAFTLNSSETFGSLNDLSTTALTIANTGTAADTLTLGGTGDGGSSVPGAAAGDLLFVATGANLTLTGSTGTTALGLVLGQSGNFDVVGTAAISSIISDGGAGFGITKTGAGMLTLSGANTFTGPTSVTGGTLAIAADSSLGTAPTTATANQLTLNGGILLATANNVQLAANRGVFLGAGGGTFSNSGSTSGGQINGIISGTGSLTVINIGTARSLALNGANTFSGGVIIPSSGTTTASQVTVGNSAGLGTGTVTLGTTGNANVSQLTLGAALNVPNPISVTSGGTRLIEENTGNSTTTESGLITLMPAGTMGATGSTINLANANGNSTLNITGGIVGTGNVIFGTSITAGRQTSNVTVSGGSVNNVGTVTNQSGSGTGSTMTISSVIGTNVTGVTQNSSVVPLVLSGANTYTSTTTVTLGTLLYNGSVGTTAAPAGAVTVASGATLGGTGILTVTNATVTGTVAPGATIGATSGTLTLNTTGGVTINGTLAIGITATGGTSLATSGTLTLGGTSILTLTGTPTLSDYTLATSGSPVSGTFGTSTPPTGYQVVYNDPAFDGGVGGDIVLEAVPEPSTLWGCALMLVGAGWYYRRERRGRCA